MTTTEQLLLFFGDDVASRFSKSNFITTTDASLDNSQLNKLALRTSNPIRFLTACKEKQVLSNPDLRALLAGIYADLIGDSKLSGSNEKFLASENRSRFYKVSGRSPFRDSEKSTSSISVYFDFLGLLVGSRMGTLLQIEVESDQCTIVVPEGLDSFPRLDDWSFVISSIWNSQLQIENNYGCWNSPSQYEVSYLLDRLQKIRLDAHRLYQDLVACKATRSNCWDFLDFCLKELSSNSPSIVSDNQNRLKLVVASCERSSWSKSDVAACLKIDDQGLQSVIHGSKLYNGTLSLAAACGLCVPKFSAFRPLGNIYDLPNQSLESCTFWLKEQSLNIKSRLVESRNDSLSKLKNVFRVFLLQDTTFIDEVFKCCSSLLSKDCTESSFLRFLSLSKGLDSDLSFISFILDDYTMEERLKAINTGVFPSEQKKFVLLEKLSLSIDDPLMELLLNNENIFKLQILFRLYLNLYYILSCFESLSLDTRSSGPLQIDLFQVTSFIRQLILSIRPFSTPLSKTVSESTIIPDIEQASEELHQFFKRALLSNSRTCELFSEIISYSCLFLFGSQSESNMTSLKQSIAGLISHWKSLSSRGDMNADVLLQYLDHKHFDHFKSSGPHRY